MSEIKGPLEMVREVNRRLHGTPTVMMGPPNFRPNTELPVIVHNYYLRGGGIGDRISALPCMVYLAKNCPYIYGRIWVAEILKEIFENIMNQVGNQNWLIKPVEQFEELCEPDTRVSGRGWQPKGFKVVYPFNGTGGHLVDCAFIEHMNKFPPPKGARIMPVIDFTGWADPIDWRWRHQGLVGKNSFVVFTPGAVSPARSVPGHYWNPVIEYVKSLGLTPVFLGANKIVDLKGTIRVNYSDGCNYSEGIDLRDKTTLMEAAWIMKNAACVVGIDNGLIQLASLTDANIVAAYNIVHAEERRPERIAGLWREIEVTKNELPCISCQSDMPQIAPPHDFKRCLHYDLECVDLLFTNNGHRFNQAIGEIMEVAR